MAGTGRDSLCRPHANLSTHTHTQTQTGTCLYSHESAYSMPDWPDMCTTICYVVESNVSGSCSIWVGAKGQVEGGEGGEGGEPLRLYADLALWAAIAIFSIRFLFIYSIHILKWPSKIRTFFFKTCQLAVIKIYYNQCTCVCECVFVPVCVWVCRGIDRSECFVYTQLVTRKSAVFCPHSLAFIVRSLSSCSTDI